MTANGAAIPRGGSAVIYIVWKRDAATIEEKIVQSFAAVCKRARKNIAENDLLKNLIRV